jgi:hypothetical protein
MTFMDICFYAAMAGVALLLYLLIIADNDGRNSKSSSR